MPRRGLRRVPRRAAAGKLVAALVVVLLAVLADRFGLFGRQGDDLSRYDGGSFPVVRHIDGDTLAVGAPDKAGPTTTIRLWGVDTPETRRPNTPVQHFGPEAAARTRELTDGQTVRLQLVPGRTRDRYERLLAYVYLPDGRLLNELLVVEGYGYADGRYDHPLKARFQAAMREARRAKRGLWEGVPSDELPAYVRETVPAR